MTDIDAARKLYNILHDDRFSWTPESVEAFHVAIEALKASCSETPNNSDCISRQAAIDAIRFGITYVKKINVETGETESIFEKENRSLKMRF